MKELWIDLQPDSPHALYEQIYEYIRKDIADGKISPGKNYRLLVLWPKICKSAGVPWNWHMNSLRQRVI